MDYVVTTDVMDRPTRNGPTSGSGIIYWTDEE